MVLCLDWGFRVQDLEVRRQGFLACWMYSLRLRAYGLG